MPQIVPDADIDDIRIAATPSNSPTRSIGGLAGPPSTDIVTDVLDAFGWSSLLSLVRAVQLRSSVDKDGVGFRYPTDELDPDEEPFHSVRVYNPIDEVSVAVPAFDRLMGRYLRTLVAGAQATHDQVLDEPWWPGFVDLTEEIERRAPAD